MILLVAISFLMSVSFPLLTYSLTLALFGLTHVAQELHFVDQRFASRIKGSNFLLALIILMPAIVAIRSAMVFGLLEPRLAYNIELILVVFLSLSSLLYARHSLIIVILVCTLALGFLFSPISTILILAVLHNLTPIGFIVEVVSKKQKKLALLFCLGVFIFTPLLILSGLPAQFIEPILGIHDQYTLFPTGALERHLGVFLPQVFHQKPWAHHAFSAITFAQCMHYVAVIWIMPKLLKKTSPLNQSIISWPKQGYFWNLIVVSTLVLVFFYCQDFFWARSIYGIAAAMHAYVEIPILLIAFAATKDKAIKKPAVLIRY